MKASDLLEAIGEIDDAAICDAEKARRPILSGWRKPAALAASICLVAAAAFALFRHSAPLPGDPILSAPREETASAQTGGQDYTVSVATPVYYSALRLADADVSDAARAVGTDAVDKVAFDESDLSAKTCCGIIEGKIVDLTVKHYTYDLRSDKFSKNGALHCSADTVVYTIAVQKAWYGADFAGKTIRVEDDCYYTEEPIFSMKKGRTYVLPLCRTGESLLDEYDQKLLLRGDVTRQSVYTTYFPFHPQIEVTQDGAYLLTDDWKTLTAKNARRVILDKKATDGKSYYKNKMRLVDSATFAEQMAVLTANF